MNTTIYMLSDVECCEPTMLRVDPKVWVRPSAQPHRSMCASADILSTDEAALEAYLIDQWGDDEATAGWTSEALSSIEEIEVAEAEWIIRASDREAELGRFTAHHPIDALSAFAVAGGFVPYSDLIEQDEADGIVYDSEHGGWCGYTEDLTLWGIFTNFTIYAVDAWTEGQGN